MHSKIRNRAIIILIVAVVGLAIVLKPHHKPGVKDFTSWSQIKSNLAENIHLGLDLRGGSHLVLQVQTDEVIKKITQQNVESAKTRLQTKNLPFTDIKDDGIGRIVVTVPDNTKNSDIVSELQSDFQDWSIDEHGNSIVATLSDAEQNVLRDRATD